ncbi:hypothetical protein [Saccharothrix australiensis]|uniref:Uncharacterized protein n=1 Tax=Saccharothrix australiensis TaxID=2072 RepID=A0A495W592_9PSEU|nr:hypothetical protein [Saccharothrix australiensis]RKT56861.1 hypothetical protein C8E97_5574 [Saccharothrix australiensis]
MSTHYDDPDRTPPRGIPVTPGRRRRPADVAAWNAAEAQHRRARSVDPRADDTVVHRPVDVGGDRAATGGGGWSVAPAVIGGDQPEATEPPPQSSSQSSQPPPSSRSSGRAERSPDEPRPAGRSFFAKLFGRDRRRDEP